MKNYNNYIKENIDEEPEINYPSFVEWFDELLESLTVYKSTQYPDVTFFINDKGIVLMDYDETDSYNDLWLAPDIFDALYDNLEFKYGKIHNHDLSALEISDYIIPFMKKHFNIDDITGVFELNGYDEAVPAWTIVEEEIKNNKTT